MGSEQFLDVGGPVHAVDHGGDGPPMLLVHGLGGSLLDWLDVAEPLTRDHHVWSIDLLGFGRTPLGGRQATIGDNQRVVDGVIDIIGGGRPVTLVGNSMGGLISVVEAAKRPSKIAELILVDPALPDPRSGRLTTVVAIGLVAISMPGIGPWMINARTARLGAERLVDETLALCTVDSSRIARSTRDAHVELTRWRQQQEGPHAAFVQASKSLVRWLWSGDTMAHFVKRVKAPTLLIHGDSDRVVSPRAAYAAAALRPDWTFRVFEDTGHIPQMERPGEFLDAVGRWLGDVRAAPNGGQEPAVAGAAEVAASRVPSAGGAQAVEPPPTSRR